MTGKIVVNARCISRTTIVAALICNVAYAQAPVTVKAYGVHVSGNIEYRYLVSNQTQARSITSLSIGNRGKGTDDPATAVNEQPELVVYPLGSYWGPPGEIGDQRGESMRLGGNISSPQGWRAVIQNYEETTSFSIDWGRVTNTDPGMPPGQTLNFSVMVSKQDPSYLDGHFTSGFAYSKSTAEGPSFWNYSGIIERLDTTTPTLTVTISPARLRATAGTLVNVTATVVVSDDYDPAPEIRLESITANEPLAAGDIVGAVFGTDDRQFQLRDVVVPKGSTGRIYTITYSATDGSGNKATTSATVSVK